MSTSEAKHAVQHYNNELFKLVAQREEELQKLDKGSNPTGNCPEYLTWAMLCRGPGVFKSLCLSVSRPETMKCCRPCAATQQAALKKGIVIENLWEKTSLTAQDIEPRETGNKYWLNDMLSIKEIIAKGRGRKVVRRYR
jgi:hypothetical protein